MFSPRSLAACAAFLFMPTATFLELPQKNHSTACRGIFSARRHNEKVGAGDTAAFGHLANTQRLPVVEICPYPEYR
jgi:hypothetical protein